MNTSIASRVIWTTIYVSSIAFINWLFVVIPPVPVPAFNTVFPPVMLVVGFVFVFRDFCQRAIGHYVLLAMLTGGAVSYFMSAPVVAIASMSAFLISETVDWLVYTVTRKPLSQRILYSSLISVPIDTVVFLHLVDLLDFAGALLVILAKFGAAIVFWWFLRYRETTSYAYS